jgi:MSHA type pilus biogenesis protein MshL
LITPGRGRIAAMAALLCCLAGCAAPPVAAPPKQDYIRQSLAQPRPVTEKKPLPAPEYTPVMEDLSPLKTRLIDISARNTPLSDVLHVIAEATGLNLLMDGSVAADYPVTLTLKRVSAENALASIFSMLDYSYSIRDNFLVVEGITTRIHELGHPSLVQSYAIDVGGDILGGATAAAAGGGGGSSIKGGVSKALKNDATAFDFWESMEKSLNSLLGKAPAVTRTVSSAQSQRVNDKGSTSQQTSQMATTVEQQAPPGEGEATGSPDQRVTVNRLSGTIVVTASKKNQERVAAFLDAVRKSMGRQVLVEARIIEVQLTDDLNYGVDWSFLDHWKGIGADVVSGFGNLNMASRSFGDVVDAAVPSFRIGTSSTNFQSLLTALKSQGDVKTLSNPRINVMNGQASLLSVGKNISFISKITSTTSTSTGSVPITTFNVETSNVLSGVIIGLVPFINDQGDISLTVTPIVSELTNLAEKQIGKVGDQVSMSLPTIDLKELSTTVRMRDGQMVVIGGLISNRENVQDDKVPLLGDIPGLGMLFTKKKIEKSKSELVVVLQPRLVNGDTQAEY